MFSCKFCKIFKNTFFHRTPPVATSEKLKAESVVRRCSVKKLFLEISLNLKVNLVPGPQACHFIKIESLTQVFPSAFCEHLSKNTFFYGAPSLAAAYFTKIRLLQGCVFLLTF